tara:strand:+ start:241 stop:1506 length:1266 start_codon:yes stop_codon:yes gene_type:complete
MNIFIKKQFGKNNKLDLLISYIKFFFKIKISFKNPPKKDVVVLDDEAIDDLKNIVPNYDYFILKTRLHKIDKIYLSLKMPALFFKYFNGSLMGTYVIVILKIIKPKVVITLAQHSMLYFNTVKALENEMNFLAIQTGARYDLGIFKYWHKINKLKLDLTKKYYFQNFFCFGQAEIDLFKDHKIRVKNFFKVGSLRLSNFLQDQKKNKLNFKKNFYDICLISDSCTIGEKNRYGIPNYEKAFGKMAEFTVKFAMKNNLKFICAFKRKEPISLEKEIDFYRENLSKNEFDYLIKNSTGNKKTKFSSYEAMIQSDIVVSKYSTMLREKLGLGGKILACNFVSPTSIYDFPIKGICSIEDCTFEEFEARLLSIKNMTEEDYFLKLGDKKIYTMRPADNKFTTIDILKEKIDILLKGNNLSNNEIG